MAPMATSTDGPSRGSGGRAGQARSTRRAGHGPDGEHREQDHRPRQRARTPGPQPAAARRQTPDTASRAGILAARAAGMTPAPRASSVDPASTPAVTHKGSDTWMPASRC